MLTRILFLSLAAATACAREAAAPAAAPAIPAPQKFDFQAIEPGPVPEDDFMPTDQDAKFSILADGTNKVLELGPLPIVDAGMLAGKSIKGACMITAKIKATGKRRTQPRFGVGVHGISGPRLRVVPATKAIEIVVNTDKEEAVATAPYTWTSGSWVWLELSVKPAPEGATGSVIEGRVWDDGKPRPEKPFLTWAAPKAPAQGKASVWGTPYSEQAIWFDDIEIKVP